MDLNRNNALKTKLDINRHHHRRFLHQRAMDSPPASRPCPHSLWAGAAAAWRQHPLVLYSPPTMKRRSFSSASCHFCRHFLRHWLSIYDLSPSFAYFLPPPLPLPPVSLSVRLVFVCLPTSSLLSLSLSSAFLPPFLSSVSLCLISLFFICISLCLFVFFSSTHSLFSCLLHFLWIEKQKQENAIFFPLQTGSGCSSPQ